MSDSPILPPAIIVSFDPTMCTGWLRLWSSEIFCPACNETFPVPDWMFPKNKLPAACARRFVLLVFKEAIERSLWLTKYKLPGPEVFNLWSIVRASLLARVIFPLPDRISAPRMIVPLLSVWSKTLPAPWALIPEVPAVPELTRISPARLCNRIGPLLVVVRSSRFCCKPADVELKFTRWIVVEIRSIVTPSCSWR